MINCFASFSYGHKFAEEWRAECIIINDFFYFLCVPVFVYVIVSITQVCGCGISCHVYLFFSLHFKEKYSITEI